MLSLLCFGFTLLSSPGSLCDHVNKHFNKLLGFNSCQKDYWLSISKSLIAGGPTSCDQNTPHRTQGLSLTLTHGAPHSDHAPPPASHVSPCSGPWLSAWPGASSPENSGSQAPQAANGDSKDVPRREQCGEATVSSRI